MKRWTMLKWWLFAFIAVTSSIFAREFTVSTEADLRAAVAALKDGDVTATIVGKIVLDDRIACKDNMWMPRGISTVVTDRKLTLCGGSIATDWVFNGNWSHWSEPGYPRAMNVFELYCPVEVRGVIFEDFFWFGNLLKHNRRDTTMTVVGCTFNRIGAISVPTKQYPAASADDIAYVGGCVAGSTRNTKVVGCQFNLCGWDSYAHTIYVGSDQVTIEDCTFTGCPNTIVTSSAGSTIIAECTFNATRPSISRRGYPATPGDTVVDGWILNHGANTIVVDCKFVGPVTDVFHGYSDPLKTAIDCNDYSGVVYTKRKDDPVYGQRVFACQMGVGNMTWEQWRAKGYDPTSTRPAG